MPEFPIPDPTPEERACMVTNCRTVVRGVENVDDATCAGCGLVICNGHWEANAPMGDHLAVDHHFDGDEEDEDDMEADD